MPEGVSLVICTHNGASRLPSAIEHLNRLEVAAGIPWEAILVDNASDDGTADVALANWKRPEPLRIVREPALGILNARLCGIREARYEILSFLDDDNWVSPDWVNAASEAMRDHPEAGACGGDIEAVFEKAPPPAWFSDFSEQFAIGRQGDEAGDITDSRGFVWGAGMCIRKSAVERLLGAGFRFFLSGRKGASIASGEDSEFCFGLRLIGWRIRYEPRLRLRHFLPAARLRRDYLCRLLLGMGVAHPVLETYRRALSPRPKSSAFRVLGSHAGKAVGHARRWLALAFRKDPDGGRRLPLIRAAFSYLPAVARSFLALRKVRRQIASLRERVPSPKS